jgi:hypothetical protein
MIDIFHDNQMIAYDMIPTSTCNVRQLVIINGYT